MCFDQEKTQAPVRDLNDMRNDAKRAKEAFADRIESSLGGGCARAMSDAEILAELFSYHSPNEITLPKYAAINQAAKNFAEVILQNCPRSADRSDAIRLIRNARMTANASVALNGLSL